MLDLCAITSAQHSKDLNFEYYCQVKFPMHGGYHVTPALWAAVDAEDMVGCVQALLELSSMIAPRMQVDLRLKGFTLQVCLPFPPPPPPSCICNTVLKMCRCST